jgi:hypothetical protein
MGTLGLGERAQGCKRKYQEAQNHFAHGQRARAFPGKSQAVYFWLHRPGKARNMFPHDFLLNFDANAISAFAMLFVGDPARLVNVRTVYSGETKSADT